MVCSKRTSRSGRRFISRLQALHEATEVNLDDCVYIPKVGIGNVMASSILDLLAVYDG